MKTEMHPVQTIRVVRGQSKLSTDVTMIAYEVYCHIHQPQEALVTGGCRGGFGVGEIIAYLYAYPFPKHQWADRAQHVFDNMENF